MISSHAYLLVFHGSRDPRTQAAALNLRDLLIAKYQSNNILTQQNYLEQHKVAFGSKSTSMSLVVDENQTPLIDIAALELADRSLSNRLVDFARQAKQQGCSQIKVVPLFLSPGVHVSSDIPAAINSALAQIGERTIIELSPFLGKYSGIEVLLAKKFTQLRAKRRILIAHGSRIPAAEVYYRYLGAKLNAEVAFWATTPKFTDVIEAQIDAGSQQIALVPYFLFPGKITRAISSKVAELQQQYPQVDLRLDSPLGATSAIVEAIAREV